MLSILCCYEKIFNFFSHSPIYPILLYWKRKIRTKKKIPNSNLIFLQQYHLYSYISFIAIKYRQVSFLNQNSASALQVRCKYFYHQIMLLPILSLFLTKVTCFILASVGIKITLFLFCFPCKKTYKFHSC